ncbi:MAG: pitrilysin family protein [Acidobacteriota bacterium]
MDQLRFLTVVSIVVAAGLLIPSRPRAATGDVLPFQAAERTLGNGLKVIVVRTGFPNLVSIQIPVQVGSRNEVEPGKSGFAHFFEHLMFRGTPATPPERYRAIMTSAGARDNASTGDDSTHYYSTFARAHLNQLIELYADMFQHLAYSEADFKTEARAILGEYNKNAADPTEKLDEVQRESFFQTHTYKHTTMGFIRDIESMPNEYEYSKLFFRRWYRPQYTTVIIAGDVTAEEVFPVVEKYWGSWQADTAAPVTIPVEPAPGGPRRAHVPWSSPTLPYVSVAFPGPAFDENGRDSAALAILGSLFFGPTSELYKRLVVTEQKVDALDVDVPAAFDPSLFTVVARVKQAADTVYVRDQILATFAAARASEVPPAQLLEAKTHDRYAFARTLDSTERIAAVIARYATYRRSYETVNTFYRTLESVEAADIRAVALRYFTSAGLMVTTLSQDALPSAMAAVPAIDSITPAMAFTATRAAAPPPALRAAAATANAPPRLIVQKSVLPQLNLKLLFTAGSAFDPAGKEGLAALTAAMIARAGSRTLPIDRIDAVLYPMAGSFVGRADKEMTTFTGIVHRDHAATFLATVLPQLLDPGFRDEDFTRLKQAQLNALVQDLRSNNEEELGKERLQTNIFRGTPYGHVALGTIAGLGAITLDDVKQFARRMYTQANLTAAINGDVPDTTIRELPAALATLPPGPAATPLAFEGRRPSGVEVEIVEKDTRSTAISLGFPIAVTRAHPDFAALTVARAWLGEHRLSSGRLYQRIREVRGINYGDYAYIEAFPRGMFQFFPDPNVARQRQLFEIWIRPVVPVNAHMTLRLAIHELDLLIRNGLTSEDFAATRDYLLNNVYVMTARQDQQLGYTLDSQWYGIGEFTDVMRTAVQRLTVAEVNAAIKRHLDARNLSIVCITKDAAALKQALASDAVSPIRYDGDKPADVLAEDKVIGAMKLNIAARNIVVTPIEQVFAR